MEINNCLSLFDDYIVTPGFNRTDISKWFSKNKKDGYKRGVYAVLNYRLEVPMLVLQLIYESEFQNICTKIN